MSFPCEAHFVVGMGENAQAGFYQSLMLYREEMGNCAEVSMVGLRDKRRRRHPGPFQTIFQAQWNVPPK